MKKSSTIFLAIIVSLTNLFIMPGEITLATAVNLVTNPSVESVSPTNASVPDSWLTGKWGTNSAIFTYDSSGYTGSKSLKVDMTNYSSGDAKWYFNPISVTPGGTYTFSDYYKSNVITSIVAQFDNGSGSYQYLNLNSNIPTSSTWQSTTSTFTVPSGYNNLTIFHLIDKVGSLNIDDMSLSEVVSSTPSVSITSPINNSSISGTIILSASATDTNGISSVQFQIDGVNTGTPINTSPYSLNWDSSMAANGSHKISAIATNSLGVQATSSQISLNVNNTTSGNFISNPSFETAKPTNSKSPLNWQSSKWGTNTTTFNYLASGGYTGNRAVQVVTSRYTNGDAKWFFDPIAVMPNTQYSFSDYYKSNINTEVDAVFTMPNGSTIYQLIGLPSASTVWTKFSTTFTVPLGATSMTIYHLIHGVGSLTIDNVNLQRYTPIGFNRPLATITFDDGFANSYTQALPLLNKYGFGSTQFITTGLVNTDGYLSTSQLQSLATAGSEIASHSVTHSNLSIATATSYTNELSASQSQ
ncbi:polysaccharide deacetylase family protein, partial [Candidatus Saccharibacteria bacterium]|nr:polysaccharide deacetylase family protein [Candidatus Saccharibacteria bacterium]